MTLPHCTGCTEPGAVTHQQETVDSKALRATVERFRVYTAALETTLIEKEHQLTEAHATIAALREALKGMVDGRHPSGGAGDCTQAECRAAQAALAQPIPPAAAKLLAERDAGRALYEAVESRSDCFTNAEVLQAVEAYRKVVE